MSRFLAGCVAGVLILMVCAGLVLIGVGFFAFGARNPVTQVVPAPVQATAISPPAPTAVPTSKVAVIEPTKAQTATVEPGRTVASSSLARLKDPFQTPVKCTGKFSDESSWLICEPGVLLDNTTAWTIPGTDEKYFFNVPEGGFWYGSMGQGRLLVDGVAIELVPEKGLNYLVLIRGRIDDGIVDSDLNLTSELTAHKPGHVIYSHMPTGAYVSKDWFRQQLVVSTTGGFTDCGATGCSRVRVVLFDVDSHFFQKFEVRAGDLDNWRLLEKN